MVALQGTPVASTGASVSTALATALGDAGTLTISQTGTNDGTIAWSFALDNTLAQYLAAGETVTATYRITLTDDSGAANASRTQDVTITITGTNDQPTITVVDVTGAVTEDTTVADNPNTVPVETGGWLVDSGSVTFAEVDDTDILSSVVALQGTPVASTGATVSGALATALADAGTLTISQTGTNDGTILFALLSLQNYYLCTHIFALLSLHSYLYTTIFAKLLSLH